MVSAVGGADFRIPIDPEAVASALDAHPDFRVARRIGTMRRGHGAPLRDGELVIAVVDVETTGFDPRTDAIIELAVQRIRIDEHGSIVEVSKPRNWLEDPGTPIPPEITAVTGIGAEDVRGRSISDGEAYCMLRDADAVLAHNAAFDRPFVDRRLDLPKLPWMCSLADIEWSAHGFDTRTLGGLLLRCGWFFEAHRAEGDVNALIHLLDHRLECGSTVMGEILRTASRPTWRVTLPRAPMHLRTLLRRRGYRWDPVGRSWFREVPDASAQAERAWALETVYAGVREPRMDRITWRERYALREEPGAR